MTLRRVATTGLTSFVLACYTSIALAAVDDSKTELWPFFESIRTEEVRSVTVRPLFKVLSDRRDQTRRVDILYPFFKWQSGADGDLDWWLAPVTYYMRDVGPDGRSETDKALLPIVFAGSSTDGSEDYFAVFPVGGTMKGAFGFDELLFVAFPAYLRLEKRGYVSQNVLWPVFGVGRGDRRSAWRVWPVYGQTRVDGDLTFRTVLWPIYTEWHRADSSTVLIFPIYHTMRSDTKRLWSVLPPLFSYDIMPSQHLRRWRIPWPLVEIARSDTIRTTHIWPVWGRNERPGRTSSFVLWPAFTSTDLEYETSRRMYRRVLLAGVSETTENEEGEREERYVQLWPLVHWTRSQEPPEFEFNILSPLWFHHGAERFWEMYGPFWTLYRHETRADSKADYILGRIIKFERGPQRRRIGLWPVCEYMREDGSTEFELLKGLVSVRTEPAGRRLRLLWFINLPMDR